MREKISFYHWVLFGICFLGTAFAGVVSTLMSVYLPVAVKDLLGSRSEADINTISAYINAVFIAGASVGGFLTGMISDKVGRKAGLIFSVFCYGVSTILTGFMPQWWAVMLCRFFSGFGLGGVLVTTNTIMLEEWPLASRSVFMGILSISMPVGIFSAGLINIFVNSWRQAFLFGVLPVCIALLSLWLLKESAQWKEGHTKAAAKMQPSLQLFSAGYRSRLLTGSLIFGSMLIGLWAIFSWLPTWIQSLVAGDGQKQRGMSMMILGMGGLAGGFLSGWMLNAFGARKSLLLCFLVCMISSFLLFRTNASFSNIIYIEILLIAFFFGASQGILSVYIPALFPVAVRGRATGFCFNTGRVLTAVAVLFVGVLVTQLGGYSNSLFVFSLVFIAGLVAIMFTKESDLQKA